MYIEYTVTAFPSQFLYSDDTLTDASDLQNFVTIALYTAAGGEGDLNTDRLSNLRKVGSAFSKFIFELPEDAGYQVLLQHCEDLWETLEQNRKLPEIMVLSIIDIINGFYVLFT